MTRDISSRLTSSLIKTVMTLLSVLALVYSMKALYLQNSLIL